MKKTILIKFGGSVMVPDLPDIEYLKKFREFVFDLKDEYRFILITGGGGINGKYNEIAKGITKITNKDLDWIGIYATRLNAKLLISIFGEHSYKEVITDPTTQIAWKEDILVGAGWKPGWSTDYVSMILGDRFKTEKILIATNTEHIFDKDPKINPDAKPLESITWEDLSNMVGDKWVPRMHIPLDPSAIKYGSQKRMNVISLNGKNLENMKAAITDKEFTGTVVK